MRFCDVPWLTLIAAPHVSLRVLFDTVLLLLDPLSRTPWATLANLLPSTTTPVLELMLTAAVVIKSNRRIRAGVGKTKTLNCDVMGIGNIDEVRVPGNDSATSSKASGRMIIKRVARLVEIPFAWLIEQRLCTRYEISAA